MRIIYLAVIGLTLFATVSIAPVTAANLLEQQYASCDDYLPEYRSVGTTQVGPQSCLMQEMEFSYDGSDYIRVDLGLNGTAEGYVKKAGPYHEYLTNSPDLIFEQAVTPGKRYLAIAQYERLRGSGIILIYPKSAESWNGKLWVTAHGRGRSFHSGSLKQWFDYQDPQAPMSDLDKVDRLILAKGYALAKTLRTSEEGVGEVIARLDDGTVVDWVAFNDTASIIKDFTLVAEVAIKNRLGKEPSRTYLYGHSAGARIGRTINYTHGLNKNSKGEDVFDGFLMDDSATGLWLPVVMQDGNDVLLNTDQEKQTFNPQIELDHQMNTKVWARVPSRPEWVSPAYLVNKRNNARILMEKGLGSRFRHYEIKQIDHNSGTSIPAARDGKVRILDLSLLIDGVVDMLDDMVEGRRQPPPSRSDWAVIGDVNKDGKVENPAIAFPEVACPLGIFYSYPYEGAGSNTAFAAFTGQGPEPVDEKDIYVDMNRNGIWDLRETPAEAWRRLDLLNSNEELTRSRYVSCVKNATSRLEKEGFFSKKTVNQYIEQAETQDLIPSLLEVME